MTKGRSQTRRKSGIKGMKLIAIKAECYALSSAATTAELKRKYPTLCRDRDFRQRKTWEYVLKTLRTHGDWIGVRVSDIETLAEKERTAVKSDLRPFTFTPERIDMDQAAENDD
ncbi:hypothetical protein LEP3755_18160 [Leptolyngbya sp. NIES-3755]|nr:hypothetical protein LEP3755_18160 [Leptolyngbya sp. NIES-3755]